MSWMHRKITDYWDENVRAIEAGARRLSSESDPGTACAAISEAVRRHMGPLPPDVIPQLCAVVAEDLYRAACATERWDGDLETYLSASAGTFFAAVTDLGLSVQYLVDNQWSDMTRPLQLFGDWFNAAGLVYICPQAIAEQLSGGDAAEARVVASQAVERCQADRRHFVQLDTDFAEDSFATAFASRESAGTVTAFRNEAPAAGTTFSFWFGGW